MNLINKILLENDLFQPRRIEEREEQKNKDKENLIKKYPGIENVYYCSFKFKIESGGFIRSICLVKADSIEDAFNKSKEKNFKRAHKYVRSAHGSYVILENHRETNIFDLEDYDLILSNFESGKKDFKNLLNGTKILYL